MKQYQMYEMSWQCEAAKGSETVIDLNAVFSREEDGICVKVKGFYAGNGICKVRFYPEHAGNYRYHVTGIVNEDGELFCEKETNPENCRKVRAVQTHFEYENGTFYYPFGTTVYALIHQKKELYNETMESLAKAPFNKIRFCVFPKYYDWNHEEPDLFAFEKQGEKWDFSRPCYAFWDRLDQTVRHLGEIGIQAELILFHPYDKWGFSRMTREQALSYLEYALRRLSAFPNIWWSLANEYDLLQYQKEDWQCFADYIGANDPYHHLLSNHNAIQKWDFSNKDTTHVCLQTSDVTHLDRYMRKYQKPVLIDECGYEGTTEYDWGNLTGFEMTDRFWKTVVQGAYCTHGETFVNEEEILWWSKGGALKGESPARIRFLRELVESFPGPLEYLADPAAELDIEAVRKIAAMPEEERPELFHPGQYFYGLLGASEEEIRTVAENSIRWIGHCREEMYLYYLGARRPYAVTLELPGTNSYRFELLDIWEMTRKQTEDVIETSNVSGKKTYRITLPGKTGMAVLATQC